jgi:hypothetical protein
VGENLQASRVRCIFVAGEIPPRKVEEIVALLA